MSERFCLQVKRRNKTSFRRNVTEQANDEPQLCGTAGSVLKHSQLFKNAKIIMIQTCLHTQVKQPVPPFFSADNYCIFFGDDVANLTAHLARRNRPEGR